MKQGIALGTLVTDVGRGVKETVKCFKVVHACECDERELGEEEGTDTLLEWETELKEAQQNDSELKLLLQLKGCPKWQEVQNYHCLQKYVSVWDQLKIQDG